MRIPEINEIMYNIRKKGQDEGITIDEYTLLKKIRHNINKSWILKYPRWSSTYDKLSDLIDLIRDSGIANEYSKENRDYIFNNSFLLPLVLANTSSDKIKLHGDNNYMFPCQFHNHKNEKAPMGVGDIKNMLNCFGCGINLNIISYLKQKEDLRYEKVIELLSMIYLFDDRISDSELAPKVEKYQKAILSDEYMDLLLRGKKRLEDRYGYNYGDENIDDIYNLRFDMIERISQKEYDPNFKYKENVKRMYLPK